MKRPSLKSGIALVEDSIITISGPALAISGIIAGVDLVTGGSILKDQAWLALVWAITLLLTLDFQVLCLGVRAHRVYSSAAPWQKKAVELLLAVIVATGVSFVSIQMQSIIARVNAESITIDQAALELGINTVALIWERSTLVLVLIFMSGWLREHDSKAVTQPESKATVSSEDVQSILARLAKLDAMEASLARVAVQEVQAATPAQLQAPEGEQANSVQGLPEDVSNDQTDVEGEQASNYSARIEALYRADPAISIGDIVTQVGCSRSTAKKWLGRVRSPLQG